MSKEGILSSLPLMQRVHVLWCILWLTMFFTYLIHGSCNYILYPEDGPSLWCTNFSWLEASGGTMVVKEGQRMYFEMWLYTTSCDACMPSPRRCNRLEDASCDYVWEKECRLTCTSCKPYIEKPPKFVFLARNSGHPQLLMLNGIMSEVTEPIEVASCALGNQASPGYYKGYCWYSNAQASTRPFYTYILSNGGPLMGSIVVTTLLAGSVSVSLSTANWTSGTNSFRVGEKAMLKVTQRDVFGNPVSSSTVLKVECYAFTAYVTGDAKGRVALASEFPKYECDRSGDGTGYVSWYPSASGNFWLRVGSGGTNIRGSPFPVVVLAGSISVRMCMGFWPSSNIFSANEVAVLHVVQKDASGNTYTGKPFNFLVRVSSRANGVNMPLQFTVRLEAAGVQSISFIPTLSGEFYINVGSSSEQISGSPFLLKVLPGPVNVSSCTGTWQYTKEFGAGDEAKFFVTQRDTNGNIVGLKYGRGDTVNLRASIVVKLGDTQTIASKVVTSVDFVTGIQTIRFYPTLAGEFYLLIGSGSLSIRDSPFPFMVNKGPLSLLHSTGEWEGGTNEFQPPGTARFYLSLRDLGGNILDVSNISMYNISIGIFEESGALFPTSDVQISHISNGSQNFVVTFSISQVGQYILTIGKGIDHLAGSPFPFYYLAGDVDPSKTIINGTGLENSTAGDLSIFSVQLCDNHGNPTGISNSSLAVSIVRFGDPSELSKNITSDIQTKGFYNVSFIAKVAGQYAIVIRWRGITLIQGPALYKTVFPGT